jgi:hypothetical protein
VPGRCSFERCPRRVGLPEGAQDAAEVNPPERRQPHVAGRFGLGDPELQRDRAHRVVPGLALRTPENGDLVRLGLEEAEPPRRLRGPAEVENGLVEPMLDAGQLAEHGVTADAKPRVVDDAQPVLDLVPGLGGARAITG